MIVKYSKSLGKKKFFKYLYEMMDVHQTYYSDHFMMFVGQIMFCVPWTWTVWYVTCVSGELQEKKKEKKN